MLLAVENLLMVLGGLVLVLLLCAAVGISLFVRMTARERRASRVFPPPRYGGSLSR